MGKLTSLLPLPSPRNSISVITSTLGTPSTWLCHAWICESLRSGSTSSSSSNSSATLNQGQQVQSVLLVSFLNDEKFHREGLRRGGIDSEKLEEKGRFAYVDGLGGLFSGAPNTNPTPVGINTNTNTVPPPTRNAQSPVAGGGRQIPIRGAPGPGPVRGAPPPPPPPQPQQAQLQSPGASATTTTTTPPTTASKHTLHIPPPPPQQQQTNKTTPTPLTSLLTTLTSAIAALPTPPLLVLESPDLLLSTGVLTALDLWDLILTLTPASHSLLLLLSADTPLLRPITSLTSLLTHSLPRPPLSANAHSRIETECSAFLGTAVHNASLVVGLRLLDTGAARDVSGVMRITVGGDGVVGGEGDGEGEGEGGWEGVEEREVLYYVGGASGSGAVEVFERGEVRS
ncbi:hypothetical protein DFH27DRAFT_652836 [Peziza echinospora]|nr:hypothetical protein DFH27DRAFT_652836 [Peziza echinospora]